MRYGVLTRNRGIVRWLGLVMILSCGVLIGLPGAAAEEGEAVESRRTLRRDSNGQAELQGPRDRRHDALRAPRG